MWDFFFPNILATPSEESEREQREANSRDELTLERRHTAGHTQIRRSVFGVPQSKSGNRLFLRWKKKKKKRRACSRKATDEESDAEGVIETSAVEEE